jgi:peptidyl-prolyl cis-trans isomerase A (cyclophilin A)
MKLFFSLIILALISFPTFAQQSIIANPTAIIKTNKGDISLELYPTQAPITVANFIKYAQSGFYDNTIFHRVIKRFMIQGGGFDKELQRKNTLDPIVNESGNGLYNNRWTIAMARTNDPDSATAQFFINVNMNTSLDATNGNPGYAVFGKVIDGQFVIKAIEKVETQSKLGQNNVPIEPIIIEKVVIKP